MQSPPFPPAPNNQSKGSCSAFASGKGSAGKGKEIPAKAPPAMASTAGFARTEAPPPRPRGSADDGVQPLPALHPVMRPHRSEMAKLDFHTIRTIRRRDIAVSAFNIRSGGRISDTVWKRADNPSTTQIAALVEELETFSDSESFRRMANAAERHIQCEDHSRVEGFIPDHQEKPCAMCNLQATSAIDKQALAYLNEDEHGGRRGPNAYWIACATRQLEDTSLVQELMSITQQQLVDMLFTNRDGCCTSVNKKSMTHIDFGKCNLTKQTMSETPYASHVNLIMSCWQKTVEYKPLNWIWI